jgi:hypothetical protein
MPDLSKKGLNRVRKGDFKEAKELFAQLTVKSDMKQKGILDADRGAKEFWGQVNEAAKKAVGLLDRVSGSVDAAEIAERIEELFSDISPSSGISYQAGVGEAEQNVDRSSTDEVLQDRIEFLEEEIRRSQEDLMEMKEELDELREENSE